MALITAAEARNVIPELGGGTTQDTLLDTMVTAAGVLMAARCGFPLPTSGARSLKVSTYAEFLDGPGGRDLTLTVRPVATITSIYDDPTLDYSAAAYLVAGADYAILDGYRGIVRLTSTSTWGAWSTGKLAIKATYTAGYTPDEGLKHLAKLAVRSLFDHSRRVGLSSVSSGGVSISQADPSILPAEVLQGLSAGGYVLPAAYL